RGRRSAPCWRRPATATPAWSGTWSGGSGPPSASGPEARPPPADTNERDMDKNIGKGGEPARGGVAVPGAENAALPILASSLLADGEHTYRNVPELVDVSTMLKVLRVMGWDAERLAGRHRKVCKISVGGGPITPEAPYELVKTMRASVLVLGPL